MNLLMPASSSDKANACACAFIMKEINRHNPIQLATKFSYHLQLADRGFLIKVVFTNLKALHQDQVLLRAIE
jgi:hypothetical protein